jgi:hypothetical protein
MRMRRLQPAALGIVLALVAVSVAPAQPFRTDGAMRVNEIYPAGPGESFVELLDLATGGEDLPYDEYAVSSYDGSGAQVATQRFTKPFPFAARDTPFVFGAGGDAPELPLAPGSGKVCFEATNLSDPRHCLRYENVPAGESVQRQPCGRGGAAAPTRGQENTLLLEEACAGRRPCDDPRFSYPGPLKMKVVGKKRQDVDSFAVRFRLSKDGDFSTRGSLLIQPLGGRIPKRSDGMAWGPIRREVKAGVPVRVKIPIPSNFKRRVKSGLRRGQLIRAFVVSVGRDLNCNPLRFHSSREYELTN